MTPDGIRARGLDDWGVMPLTDPLNPGPIVVGIERSERSLDGLAFARTLARTVETPLILVAVHPIGGRSAALEPEAAAEEAQTTLDWAAHALDGVRAQLRTVADTSVARGLQRVAEEASALAIVVG